jgi:hypothetical protein
VDKMSSAHVYVRLHRGQTIDGISEGLLEDCAQLVKANSIQGKSKPDSDSSSFYKTVHLIVCILLLYFVEELLITS